MPQLGKTKMTSFCNHDTDLKPETKPTGGPPPHTEMLQRFGLEWHMQVGGLRQRHQEESHVACESENLMVARTSATGGAGELKGLIWVGS